MFRLVLYVFFVLGITFTSTAQRQLRTVKPVKTYPLKTNLGIGIGLTNSVVFLARNTNENNAALGLHTSLVYEGSKLFRVTFEYTHYSKIDIAPTWYNVKANTIESNVHILYHSKGNLFFYPLFGLSLNTFKGHFTGLNDNLNLAAYYARNSDATSRWLGLNAGVGLEYQVKPVIIYASFKMRVGFSEGHKELNILDVCYSIGLRYNLRVPSVYKIFKGHGRRYYLDADK